MKTTLKKLDLLDVQSGAGTGKWLTCDGEILASVSPVNGRVMGKVRCAGEKAYERVIARSMAAFQHWRMVQAPKRGEVVRQIGLALRRHKQSLGELVSLEVGKIRAEGEGEVQEMIDMADFAVGLSRQLYGLTMASERLRHRMYEQWHPLGPVGVVTAFNFPVAVWAWNALIALIAGDTVIWKPSSKAFLSAVATMKIAGEVLDRNRLPPGILNMVVGNREQVGEALLQDRRVPLISATGSVRMGRHVAKVVGGRLGRTLLELGGNNGVVVTPRADIQTAVRAIVFGAVGTAGQRCTTTRRVVVHKSVFDSLADALIRAYEQIKIGHPLKAGTLMGPLIDRAAVTAMMAALEKVRQHGGRILYGGNMLSGKGFGAGTYVTPCICRVSPDCPMVREETFAPILYLMPYKTLEEAIEIHNAVPQGLSSAIFSDDIKETETFLSHVGSDCGIANVNVGTSGAEIGGAFGGEKDTGGGRESGSDSWKAYMRRQTNTLNWSGELPLAQGIRFDIH